MDINKLSDGASFDEAINLLVRVDDFVKRAKLMFQAMDSVPGFEVDFDEIVSPLKTLVDRLKSLSDSAFFSESQPKNNRMTAEEAAKIMDRFSSEIDKSLRHLRNEGNKRMNE